MLWTLAKTVGFGAVMGLGLYSLPRVVFDYDPSSAQIARDFGKAYSGPCETRETLSARFDKYKDGEFGVRNSLQYATMYMAVFQPFSKVLDYKDQYVAAGLQAAVDWRQEYGEAAAETVCAATRKAK